MTLDNTTTVPKVVAAALLQKYHTNRVYSQRVNNAYRSLLRGSGDTVIINTHNAVTIGDYTVGGTLSYTAADVGGPVELALTKQKSWAVSIDDINAAKSRPNVLAAAVSQYGEELATVVDGDVRNAMYEATFSNFANRTAGNNRLSTLDLDHDGTGEPNLAAFGFTTMARAMDANNVPNAGRWVIVGPLVAEYLQAAVMNDTRLLATSQRERILINGELPYEFAGFRVYKSRNVLGGPSSVNRTGSSNAAVNTGVPSARSPQLDDDEGFEEVIFGVDSATAFIDQVRRTESIRLQTTFADAVRGLYTYGVKVLNNEWLYGRQVKVANVPE